MCRPSDGVAPEQRRAAAVAGQARSPQGKDDGETAPSSTMVETHWEDLRGTELRYRDHAWALTGDVSVRDTGELLVVEAEQVDGSKRGTARLYFSITDSAGSLNPGNLGTHFNRLERDGTRHAIVVKKEGRSYRYELTRLEYE